MEKPRKSLLNLLNPLTWLDAVVGLLVAIFAPILRLFGRMPPPNTEGFENIQASDVDDADRLAKQQQAAADAMARAMSPAEVVRLYARAHMPAVRRWICLHSAWRNRTGCCG